MPILKAPRKQYANESLQLRVSSELKMKLQSYAQFLNATPSYIVTEALDRIFRKDHEFRAWLQQHPESASANQTESNSNLEMKKES